MVLFFTQENTRSAWFHVLASVLHQFQCLSICTFANFGVLLCVSPRKLHKFISRTESATAKQEVHSSAGFRRPQMLQPGPGEICTVPGAALPVWCDVCTPAAALPSQDRQQLLLAVKQDWKCWLCDHRHLCGKLISTTLRTGCADCEMLHKAQCYQQIKNFWLYSVPQIINLVECKQLGKWKGALLWMEYLRIFVKCFHEMGLKLVIVIVTFEVSCTQNTFVCTGWIQMFAVDKKFLFLIF